ncbi:MAG: HlyD family efflux transporter periplasmic adaptor subunit [Planctomycetes bacterium]|nr:HlyD family efflux transporter periplasmic adaptor subunit [Planctomycetota bacterium]
MLRFVLFTQAVVLLICGGVWLDQHSQPAVRHSPASRESSTIHASGRVEGATPDIELRFETVGKIAAIHFEEGAFVESGTVLAVLDDATARHRVALMQAEFDQAEAKLLRLRNGAHEQERLEVVSICEARQAQLRRAQVTLQRNLKLDASTLVSKQEVDNCRGEVEALTHEVAAVRARLDRLNAPPRHDELQAAEAQVAAARAHWELSRTELRKTELIAPTCGQVVKLGFEPGELTGPQEAEPVVVMIDTRQLRVRAFVEEMDIGRVRAGQSATIHPPGPAQTTCQGLVRVMSPRMSRKQAWTDHPDERFDLKTREILIDLPDSCGLLPGLSVDVQIELPR